MNVENEEVLYLESEEFELLEAAWRLCNAIYTATHHSVELEENAENAWNSLEWLLENSRTEKKGKEERC